MATDKDKRFYGDEQRKHFRDAQKAEFASRQRGASTRGPVASTEERLDRERRRAEFDHDRE